MQTRPSFFTADSLVLRNGLLGGDAVTAIDNIEKTERLSAFSSRENVLKLAFIAGLEKPNTAIYLKEPIELEKPLGITQSGRILLLSIDQQESFFAFVETVPQVR